VFNDIIGYSGLVVSVSIFPWKYSSLRAVSMRKCIKMLSSSCSYSRSAAVAFLADGVSLATGRRARFWAGWHRRDETSRSMPRLDPCRFSRPTFEPQTADLITLALDELVRRCWSAWLRLGGSQLAAGRRAAPMAIRDHNFSAANRPSTEHGPRLGADQVKQASLVASSTVRIAAS